METRVTSLDLFEEQRKLESESRAFGKQAFLTTLADAAKSGEASREGAYRKLVEHGLEVVEAELLRRVCTPRRAGGRHIALRWIELFDEDMLAEHPEAPREGPGIVAYLALRVALDGIAQGTTVMKAATRLSDFIVDELRYRKLKREHPAIFDLKLAQFKKRGSTSYDHMSGSLDMTLQYMGVDAAGLTMTQRDKVLVGCLLLDVVHSATNLIKTTHGLGTKMVSSRRGDRRTRLSLMLEPGPDVVEWIAGKNERYADLAFMLYPLVIPPVDWAQMQRGGYYHSLRNAFPLVATFNQQVSAAHERRDQPVVFGALNALQKTAWRINAKVLALIEALEPELKNRSVSVAGLEAYEPSPMPTKTAALLADRELWMAWQKGNRGALSRKKKIPADVDAARLRWRDWRRKAGEAKDRDVPRRSRVVAQGAAVAVARKMALYPAIYFPYSLDFRGRIYVKASHLNPQGDDLNKALLTFATGKPLGDAGARWLAIHGANTMDTTPEGAKLGHMTLDDRERWVLRHTAEIRRSATEPLQYRWWTQADKPLQFLAFCFEWTAAMDERAQTGEWSYECSLPVAMDGSCNGLQHFSAMFRDHIGGRAVNLTNNDTPRDVYAEVAKAVGDMLVAKAPDPMAMKWLSSGLVNRKLAKRPTMTFGYGAKKWGFRDQLFAELKGRDDYGKTRKLFAFEEDGRAKDGTMLGCTYLSGIISDALGVTVVAAARAMRWLQTYAMQISRANNAVEWTVPVTGFKVRQEYYKRIERRVKTTLAGTVKLTLSEDTGDVRAIKQANGVAPNIVHSLDAAVCMLTVLECAHEGISHFRMIHDSFGTLAADAPKMAEITRRVFVEFYTQNDVPRLLAAQLTTQLPEGSEIPALPEYGALNIMEVHDSKYFFA
jgi:DNA-directed RNA polymerase, mitochondrial